ncbi:MAG: lysophospholipid acyltransferase family protein [bacterium]
MKLLLCVWSWFLVIGSFVSHAVLAPILAIFARDKEACYYWSCRPFLVWSFRLAGITLDVQGLEHIPKKGPFVIVSNHQSLLDIWIHIVALPIKVAFFAKEELLKVPILGRDIRKQGHFYVDRRNPRKAKKQMEGVKARILEGQSILIFPEGTRSMDDRIASFKRGAFQIALETGTRILPVYLQGSGAVLRKNSFWILPAPISVRIGPVIIPTLLDDSLAKSAKALAATAETAVKRLAPTAPPLS